MHTTLSIFNMFSVHAWSWCGGLKQITLCIDSLRSNSFDMPIGAKMCLAPK